MAANGTPAGAPSAATPASMPMQQFPAFSPAAAMQPYGAPPPYGYFGGAMPSGPLPPAVAGLIGVQQAVGAVGSIIQLLGMNAQAVQQVSGALIQLLEGAGQAAGEFVGVLGNADARSQAAPDTARRAQRRRFLRWAIGLFVLVAAYHGMRWLVRSRPAGAGRPTSFRAWLLHLTVFAGAVVAGHAVGPKPLHEAFLQLHGAMQEALQHAPPAPSELPPLPPVGEGGTDEGGVTPPPSPPSQAPPAAGAGTPSAADVSAVLRRAVATTGAGPDGVPGASPPPSSGQRGGVASDGGAAESKASPP